jgi:hypothetical protein
MAFLAPVIAAVSAFASTAIGGFIVNAIVGIGLSLASTLFAKKPEKAVGGTKLDVQYGADMPREIAVGLVAIAGHDVYSNTYGESNKYLQKVFVLSDFPITGLTRVAVNGEWRAINGADTEARGALVLGFPDNNDVLRIRVYDGRHTELQAAEFGEHGLVGSSNPGGRWTAAHVGRGTAFVVANYRFKDEEMASVPTLLFEFRGAPLYDLRKDTTAGGSGTHRWDDQSTWGYSENPMVQSYVYERGFFVSGQLLVGKGMPSRDLPAAPWMSAMNVCDETTPTRARRYRAGALFNTGDGVTHRDNLEPIFEAASAALAELVDGDRPIVGANQPVVATISDDDLIIGAPWQFQAKRSRSELVNSVYGTFNSPDDLWSATAYGPRVSATALTADRERHARPFNFSTVDNALQASDLAEAQLRRNRYQASETITVRPRWVTLELGDWITRASARYGTRTFQVVGRKLGALAENGARNVTLTLDEVGAGIYDTSVTVPERQIRVVPAPPFFISTVQGLVAFPGAVTAENGRVMPAIDVQWDAIEDLTVNAVLVRYWKTSDPANTISKVIQLPAVAAILVEGVLPLTAYSVDATVITDPARATIWADPVAVFTLGEDLAFTAAQFQADVVGALQFFSESSDRLGALIEGLATSTAINSTFFKNATDRLNNDTIEIGARVIHEQTVREAADAAFAEDLTRTEARVDSVETQQSGTSLAVSVLTSRVDTTETGLTSVAELVNGVKTTIDDPVTGLSAQSAAINVLQSETGTAISGGLSTTSRSLAELTASLDLLAADIAAGTAGAMNSIRLANARTFQIDVASVSRDEAAASRISGAEARLASVETGVAGNALATQALTTRVAATESGLSSTSSAVTTANARIDGVEGVNAGQATSISSLSGQVSTLNGQTSANAEAILGVSAEVAGAFASGLIRFQAVAAPGGVSSRIAILARASTGTGFVETGTYWDAMPDGTGRIVNLASRFIVTDGVTSVAPLIVSGGVVRLNVAYFNVLQSTNGQLVINGNGGGYISMSDNS